MGMQKRVVFPSEPPAWPAVVALLAEARCAVEMRMIDGELAFPDEQPPEGWREIRVAASGAMVTVRRGPNEVVLVAWGNADAAQERLWHALAEAFTRAGQGQSQDGE
jgi:hypothetical protein